MWKKKNSWEDSQSSGFSEEENNDFGMDDPFSTSWDEEPPKKTKKKSRFPVEAVLAVAVILAAAALILNKHRHVWIEATCTTVRVCEGCGETEGEPLGHDWMDATLHAPETCSRCLETRGVTLADAILEEAAVYAGEGNYRLAIRKMDEAWEMYGFQLFRDLASDYRLKLGNYHSSHVAGGKYNSILIHRGGQITIVGDNKYKELAAGDWANIAAAAAGDEYVAALRNDGTVVAAGRNRYKEYTGAESWTDVVAISAGDFHLVGLLADGTIVAAPGYDHCDQAEVWRLMDAAQGKRVVAVSAGYDHTLALLEDGTVVACGDTPTKENKENGVCNVSHWRQIAAICSGTEFCAGLRTDGTVVVAGVDWDLSGWTEVHSLAAGDFFLLGLKEDGTVLYQIQESDYDAKRCQALSQVLEWDNIVFIAAGHDQIIGICSDGTVRCAGVNQNGQCSLDGTTVSMGE